MRICMTSRFFFVSSLRVLCLWTTFGRRRVSSSSSSTSLRRAATMPSRPNVPVPRAKGIERFGAKENEKKETTTSSRHKRKQALVGFDLDLVQGEMTMNSALKESSFSSSSSKGREESKVEKNDDDTRERASSSSSSSSSSSKALSRTTTT